VVTGLYATLVGLVARVFPTPGPTDEEVAQLLEEQKAKREKKERKAAYPTSGYKGSKLSAIKAALHLPGSK
jgi:hypothetical protein